MSHDCSLFVYLFSWFSVFVDSGVFHSLFLLMWCWRACCVTRKCCDVSLFEKKNISNLFSTFVIKSWWCFFIPVYCFIDKSSCLHESLKVLFSAQEWICWRYCNKIVVPIVISTVSVLTALGFSLNYLKDLSCISVCCLWDDDHVVNILVHGKWFFRFWYLANVGW